VEILASFEFSTADSSQVEAFVAGDAFRLFDFSFSEFFYQVRAPYERTAHGDEVDLAFFDKFFHD
jgi:hypothetical protein